MTQKKILLTVGIPLVCLAIAVFVAYKYVNPAPPNRLVITTGNGEGDYQTYAKLYKEIIKEDGVELVIRPSTGATENLKKLKDPKSDVDAGFVQDGLGSAEEEPDLVSLGSLYYEPIWIFYRAKVAAGGRPLTRFSQLKGMRIAAGQDGGGTRSLSLRLLKAAGIDETNTRLLALGWQPAVDALIRGEVDVAVFLATPEEALIKTLLSDKQIRLMSVDQAEAITRHIPFLHHLVLPHGAIDLKANLPEQDTDLISPTATLLVKDTLHPALMYLLLKAASQVHGEPGIFEKKDEFPINKDYQFPLSDEAKSYYKSGTPFWQRYLPFWVATLVERFILLVIPMIALILPIIKAVPRLQTWRIRSRIYQRYGELKYLETQIKPESGNLAHFKEYLEKLDHIEARVNHMKVPLDFSDHVYVLREHIDFVRARIRRALDQNAGSR